MPSPEGAAVAPVPGDGKPRRALGEAKKGVEGTEEGNTQVPVACVNGMPREPAHTGTVARVDHAGNGSEGLRGIMHEINQQILRSKYKFKEGAPLKEYLQQRVPSLGNTCTFVGSAHKVERDNPGQPSVP